ETTQSFFNIFGTAIRFTRTRDNGDKTPVTSLLAGLRISQATLTRKRYAQNKCQRSADQSLRAEASRPAMNTHIELVSGGCQSNTATQSPVERRYQQQAVGQPEQHEGADRGLA